jgi:AcrR family transcriptional regulator
VNPVTEQTRPDPIGVTAPSQRADALRNRQKIVKAARACLCKDGLDAQMEEIARRAKVGVGTVYRHFPTKGDLVAALAAERFERLAELAREAIAAPNAWEAFCEFLRESAQIQVADRALSEAMLENPAEMRKKADHVHLLALVTELMDKAKATGKLRPDAEPEDVPMMMCALGGAAKTPAMDWERYLGLVIDGFRAPGSTPLPARAS